MGSKLRRQISCTSIVASWLLLSRASMADLYPAGYDWRAADPLVYAHVVIEGTIDQVEIKNVRGEGAIAVLHLSGLQALRGPVPDEPPYAEFDEADWREWQGRHVVLCAYWSRRLERYVVLREGSALWLRGAVWTRKTPLATEDTLTDSSLRSRIAAVQPRAIIRRAEAIVSGTISAIQDSLVEMDGQKRGKIRIVTMESIECIAGDLSSARLRFLGHGWEDELPWPQTGERWMAFLERRNADRWIIRGKNGLLKVGVDGELLYDGCVPYPLSKEEIIAISKDGANERSH